MSWSSVRAIVLACLGALLCTARSASADPITFRLTAVVTRTELAADSPIPFPFDAIPAGTPLEVVWRFDSDAVDRVPQPDLSQIFEYGPAWDVEIRVGDDIVIRRGPAGRVGTSVDIRTVDVYAVEWLDLTANGTIPVREARFYARGPLGATFSDDSLPIVPPDAAAFSAERNLSLAGPVVDGKYTWTVTANITAFSLPVPESRSLALVGLAGLVFAVVRRLR